MDLRVLARKLEKSSDDILISASQKDPETFEKVATAIAAASTLLEGVADDMDNNASFSFTENQLDEIAALASAFDESDDPLLKKQASVLDELLLSIASPKNAIAQVRKVTEDEINRLREERRRSRREEAYEKPREAHADMNNAKEQAKAVEQDVKRYMPLEAPLQTRYPPDRPGGQMTRITDHVYQDIATGKIYDFKNGYTTEKGNKIPGGSVENQTRQLGDYRNQGASLFETRESLMGRYASGGDLHHIKKYALGNEIETALRAVRDKSPELLDSAIDMARDDGLSTTEVGNALGGAKFNGSLDDALASAGWQALKEAGKDNRESLVALALNAIQELAPHLLNPAVSKAREEGLSDQQIKSILVSDSGKFDAEKFGKNAEVRIANVLFPYFKSLGWSDLIIKQLKVMSGLGVDKNTINKLALANGLKKKVRVPYTKLIKILKEGAEPLPFDIGEPGDEEYEPLELDEELTNEVQVLNPEPEFEGREPASESGKLLTPQDDLSGWIAAFKESNPKSLDDLIDEDNKEKPIYNPVLHNEIDGLLAAGKREQGYALWYDMVNKLMNAKGYVGAFETEASTGKQWREFAKALELANLPEKSEEDVASEEPAKNKGYFKWEEYQKKNNVFISESTADKVVEKAVKEFNHEKDRLRSKMRNFKFAGKEPPHSYYFIPGQVRTRLRDFVEGSSRKGSKPSTASIVNFLNGMNVDFSMIPIDDIGKIRDALLSPRDAEIAGQILQEASGKFYRHAVNKALEEEGLPGLYPETEVMTDFDFAHRLEEEAKAEPLKSRKEKKEKASVIKPIPEDEHGNPYITIWEEPRQYVEALAAIKKKYPLPSKYAKMKNHPDIVKKWDEAMMELGYVPPSEKLFGNKTTHAMLFGFNEVGDPIPSKVWDYKNLFANPEEYLEKYQEVKDQFGEKYKEVSESYPYPIEFERISGSLPSEVPNIDRKLKNVVFQSLRRGPREKEDGSRESYKEHIQSIYDAADAMNHTKAEVDHLRRIYDNSGQGAQRKLAGIIFGGPRDEFGSVRRNTLDEVKSKFSKYISDMKKKDSGFNVSIPQTNPPLIDMMVHQRDMRDLEMSRINKAQDDLMESQGYYPPNKTAIGTQSFKDLLRMRRPFGRDVVSGPTVEEISKNKPKGK